MNQSSGKFCSLESFSMIGKDPPKFWETVTYDFEKLSTSPGRNLFINISLLVSVKWSRAIQEQPRNCAH